MAFRKDNDREEVPTIEVEMEWVGIMTDPPEGVKPLTIKEPWVNARDHAVKIKTDYWPRLPTTGNRPK